MTAKRYLGGNMRTVMAAAAALILAACGDGKDEDAGASEDKAAVSDESGEDSDATDADQKKGDDDGKKPDARRSRADYLRFERGVIVDPTGFSAPLAAASLFVPYGWKTTGGVAWARQFACTNGYNFDWRAASADGAEGVAVTPQFRWENNSYGAAPTTPGCGSAPFTTARAYVEASVKQWKPDARLVSWRERPDILKAANAQATRTPMPMGEARTWAESGEATFDYEENGRSMRGSFAALVRFQAMITDMSNLYATDPTIQSMPSPSQSQMSSLSAFAEPGWLAYAPREAFRPALYEAIRRSIRPNESWGQAIAGHNLRIAQVAQQETQKRAAAWRETNDAIQKIRQEAWDSRQESADRRIREFGEMMKGVETYKDESAPGGQVELSHSYRDAWRLNDGTYILSNDPNFDPNRDLSLDAKKLNPAE